MKKTFILILVFCAFGCQKDKYFKDLELNGKLQYVGKNPINSKIAEKSSCYFFDTQNDNTKSINYLEFNRVIYEIRIIKENGFEVRSYFNEKGNPISFNGVYSVRYKIDENGNYETSFNYDKDNNLIEDDSNIAQYQYFYDDNGFVSKVFYYDKNGNRTELNKASSVNRTFDKSGNLKTVKFLNDKEELIKNAQGISIIELFYKNNNLIRQVYLDSSNKPTIDNKGVASIGLGYDSRNNLTSISNYGLGGVLINPDEDNAKYVYEYDQNNNLISTSYFNRDEKLIKNDIAIKKHIRDEFGRIIETQFYNYEEKLTNDNNGISIEKNTYDNNNNIISESYFDQSKKPIVKSGYHKIIYSKNPKGEILSEEYYDINNQPISNTKGYHLIKYTRNEKGQSTSESYFDTKKQPMTIDDNCHLKKYSYSENEGLSSIEYYGIDKEPIEKTWDRSKFRDFFGRQGTLIKYSKILYKNHPKNKSGKTEYVNISGDVVYKSEY